MSNYFQSETGPYMKALGIYRNSSTPIVGLAMTGYDLWRLVDDHIRELKGIGVINNNYNLWSKFVALYPMLGGTAARHGFNIKDARDLDVAFRITWSNNFPDSAHTKYGVQGPGAPYYGNTHLVPSTSLSLSSVSIFRYINQQTLGDQYEMGVFSFTTQSFLYTRTSLASAMDNGCNGDIYVVTAQGPGPTPFKLLTRTDTIDMREYHGNVGVTYSNAINNASLSTYEFPILGLNDSGAVTLFNTSRWAYAGLGFGLTDAESVALSNVITDFQTRLGRQ